MYEAHLRSLLSPLGIYDLEEHSASGAAVCALGTGLDTVSRRLEEIEREMAAIDGVELCCCIFDEKKSRLKGFYIGSVEKDALHAEMKEKLPAFMVPGILRRVEDMPLTKNGKIDRKKLAELVGGKTN